MKLINLLQILLILITVLVILSKNNLKIVVYFSVFSLISASLYYLLSSPDLALAEVAIGSAITPLILIIAISKQRDFLVISHLDRKDKFLRYDGEVKGKGYQILEEFTNYYKLKLLINDSKYDELQGVFRSRNVDLVVEKSRKSGKYILKGKETSTLMNKLEQMTKQSEEIMVIKISEDETYD